MRALIVNLGNILHWQLDSSCVWAWILKSGPIRRWRGKGVVFNVNKSSSQHIWNLCLYTREKWPRTGCCRVPRDLHHRRIAPARDAFKFSMLIWHCRRYGISINVQHLDNISDPQDLLRRLMEKMEVGWHIEWPAGLSREVFCADNERGRIDWRRRSGDSARCH